MMQCLINPLQMLHLVTLDTIYYVRIYTPFSDSSLEEVAFISSAFSLQVVLEKQ